MKPRLLLDLHQSRCGWKACTTFCTTPCVVVAVVAVVVGNKGSPMHMQCCDLIGTATGTLPSQQRPAVPKHHLLRSKVQTSLQ